jgi:hypothetical protein
LGSKYDVDFVNWTDSYQGEAQFTFGTTSKKTTGIIKASNRFIKILLTYAGSDPFALNRGTQFEDIQTMGGDTDADIGTFASEQIKSAFSQVQEIQAANAFPEDENISKVTLTNVVRADVDKMVFYISIVTEAGEGVTVTIPIIGG